MRYLKKKSVRIAMLLILLAAFFCCALDARLKIQRYSVVSDKIAANVRIALITDLHSCRYGSNQSTLVEAIDAQKPDMILFGGDICDDARPHENTEALLQAVADRYPCYYVTGNHEYWGRDIDTVLALFRAYGVTVLNGATDTIEVRGQSIRICGITDPDVTKYTDSGIGVQEQLEACRSAPDDGAYTVLLAHRPELIQEYAAYGFDLVLSGHAHGGQWRLPGLINGLYAPNQGMFPKYAGGRYTVDETVLIVSRGLARESTKVPRIFNRPELVVVDVMGASESE